MSETLRLACAPNFRDIGGLPAADGKLVRRGRVYRSDLVVRPIEVEATALASCGIGLVFDLRSAHEAGESPNHHWIASRVEIRSFDIGTDVRARNSFWERLRDDASPAAVNALMMTIYRALPAAVLPALRDLFDALARDAPPVLLHCAAGKDRTGITVAMLLSALDVPYSDIMADYMETAERVTPKMVSRARRMFSGTGVASIPDESLDLLASVREAFLAHSYSYLDRKFGGVDAFLRDQAGLDDDKRAALRARLLEPA